MLDGYSDGKIEWSKTRWRRRVEERVARSKKRKATGPVNWSPSSWKKGCFVSSALKVKFLGMLEDDFFEYDDFESINIPRWTLLFPVFLSQLELEL